MSRHNEMNTRTTTRDESATIDQSNLESSLLAPTLKVLVESLVLDENDICAQQVPVIRSKVDVVCMRSRDSTLLSIELKKSSWIRANDQAKRHGAWSHRTYISMDSTKMPDTYMRTFSVLGIGVVLTKNNPVTLYRRSPKTKLSSLHLSKIVRAYVKVHGKRITSLL